ncbi:MAG: cytochrome-c peroxidase [Candidatus Kapaibacterium sp.]
MSASGKGLTLSLIVIAAVVYARTHGDADTARIPQPVGFPERVYRGGPCASDSAVAALGALLFEDPVLSVDSSTSCESCHQPFAAFSHIDHALSHGVEGRIGRRNVPSLQNLAWQTSFMWDGSIANLDMQSLSPITGHEEMSENLDHLLAKLTSHPAYPARFGAAFGSDSITIPRVLRALGRFVAGLVTANSRYDRAMQGKDTLADNEQRGLQLFRRHCATCHKEPLFTSNDFASNGLQPSPTEPDSGRIRITHDAQDLYRFKIPSLRNITRSHPYMHDGRFKRLRDVLAHYANPATLPDHTDPRVRAIGPLTDVERKDIIAFLITLEDR